MPSRRSSLCLDRGSDQYPIAVRQEMLFGRVNPLSGGETTDELRRGASATLWMRAASGLEILTGLGLVVAPSLLTRLLFGSGLNAAGEATGRIAGLVMLCLAVGCWPRAASAESHALAPLLALSVLAALYLIVVGFGGTIGGMLLGLPRRSTRSRDSAGAGVDESAREMTKGREG